MSKLSTATAGDLRSISEKVNRGVARCHSLEEVARVFANSMYEEFKDSIVLVRLFAAVPFRELPDPVQAFVKELSAAKGIASLVRDETLVLTLLGTRGASTAWNSRHESVGHVGIPLASAAFVEGIPMIARLLKELGVDLSWIDSADKEMVSRTLGKSNAIFYVEDGQTAVDNKGRKIIAAQDFVQDHQVKTVFGFGGGYSLGKNFITTIFFTREHIPKRQIEMLLPILSGMKASTVPMVSKGSIFSSS